MDLDSTTNDSEQQMKKHLSLLRVLLKSSWKSHALQVKYQCSPPPPCLCCLVSPAFPVSLLRSLLCWGSCPAEPSERGATHSRFVRGEKMPALSVCLPQPCPSAGRRFAMSRSRLNHFYHLFRFHNNELDEMPCKLDSTEFARSFWTIPNPAKNKAKATRASKTKQQLPE